MEALDKRIKEINQELIDLTGLKESLENQLKTLDIQITQKIGAINELKTLNDSLDPA